MDGRGPSVRLQHPLGLTFHQGKLYVADTDNDAIRVIDLGRAARVSTLPVSGAGLR